MNDPNKMNEGSRSNDPARSAFAIAPSDSIDIPFGTRGLYVGVSGDVVVTMLDDKGKVTFVGLAAGVVHPIAAKRVWSTGTSATSILGVR